MTPTERLRNQIARCPGSITVVFGSASTPGLLDFSGSPMGPVGQAPVAVEVITCRFIYADLPGLGPDAAITCGDIPYIVAQGPHRLDDGLEAVVVLEAV